MFCVSPTNDIHNILCGSRGKCKRPHYLCTSCSSFYETICSLLICQPGVIPRFQAYFTVSYGLNREDLERINFLIKSSDTVPYTELVSVLWSCSEAWLLTGFRYRKEKSDLPFTVEVFSGLKPPPTVILQRPLLVNLYGAGFTKAPQSRVSRNLLFVSASSAGSSIMNFAFHGSQSIIFRLNANGRKALRSKKYTKSQWSRLEEIDQTKISPIGQT